MKIYLLELTPESYKLFFTAHTALKEREKKKLNPPPSKTITVCQLFIGFLKFKLTIIFKIKPLVFGTNYFFICH